MFSSKGRDLDATEVSEGLGQVVALIWNVAKKLFANKIKAPKEKNKPAEVTTSSTHENFFPGGSSASEYVRALLEELDVPPPAPPPSPALLGLATTLEQEEEMSPFVLSPTGMQATLFAGIVNVNDRKPRPDSAPPVLEPDYSGVSYQP